jgi:hypothetical protein
MTTHGHGQVLHIPNSTAVPLHYCSGYCWYQAETRVLSWNNGIIIIGSTVYIVSGMCSVIVTSIILVIVVSQLTLHNLMNLEQCNQPLITSLCGIYSPQYTSMMWLKTSPQ